MTALTKLRVPLTMLHGNGLGPGWTDLLIRDDTDDMAIVEEIMVQDTYRLRGLDLSPEMPFPPCEHPFISQDPVPQVVVDLGANIGVFAMTCVRMGARVIAVEPEPANADLLRRNLGNQARNVEVLQAAVGAEDGRAFLSGGAGTGHVGGTGVEVAQITLAQILAPLERVALCKIDVEGSEASIVLACPHDELAKCEHIRMEIHAAPMCPWIERPRWGEMIEYLMETHSIQAFGRPSEGGGMLLGVRYPT